MLCQVRSRLFFLFLFLNLQFPICGQEHIELPKILTAEQVLLIIKKYHPVLAQASINNDISSTNILSSRGLFDPNLSAYKSVKNLKNIEYYNDINIDLTIPTWYGIDIQGGTENLSGSRLDNSQTLGDVSYLGINVPILKNLAYDKRRATLDQAKVFYRISLQDQVKTINDLNWSAMNAYWSWVRAYELYRLMDTLVRINENRLDYVKRGLLHGERPAMDTTEAKTQLISFKIEKNNRWTEFLNAGNELSQFLWIEGNQPYQLPTNIIPYRYWNDQFESKSITLQYENILTNGIQNHPEVVIYKEKLDIYSIQKKLYFQNLLPKLDLNYRVLSSTLMPNPSFGESFPLSSNFSYGIKLDVPLRLSEGRATFRAAKLKLNAANLDLDQKIQQISIKIKNYFNDYLNYVELARLQYENYNNYYLLVRAEETKFRNGESNLFTINARENKALEATEKLIDIKVKYHKSIYGLYWSAGLLR